MKIILKSVDEEEGSLTLELGLVDFLVGSIIAEDSDGESTTYVPRTHEVNQANHIKFLEDRLRRTETILESERRRAQHNYDKWTEAQRLQDGFEIIFRGDQIESIQPRGGPVFTAHPPPNALLSVMRERVESLKTQLAVAQALADDRLKTIKHIARPDNSLPLLP